MKVCILGDGLTSLTLAKALVNENIYVEIFTNKKKNIIDKTRTIGITKSNLEFINDNIINIEKISWKLNKIEIFSEKLNREKLLKFEDKNDQLFSIVKNYKLQEILEKSLLKNKFFKKNHYKNILTNINNYDLIINLIFQTPFRKNFLVKR